MSTAHAALKLFRKLHLYIGVFISPALIFFAFTGALQTFGLHEASKDGSYKPSAFIATMGQIHKKQTWMIPVRKPRPDAQPGNAPAKRDVAPTPEASATPQPAAPQSPAPAKERSHLPLKIFFLLVSLGLFTSTLTGLYMSYKYNHSKMLITAILIAGAIIPLLMLPL